MVRKTAIEKETEVATQNLGEEYARRLQISEIESRYTADVHEVIQTVSLAQQVLVETTTKPIMGKFWRNLSIDIDIFSKFPLSPLCVVSNDETISVCRSTKARQKLSPEMRTLSKLFEKKRTYFFCFLPIKSRIIKNGLKFVCCLFSFQHESDDG